MSEKPHRFEFVSRPGRLTVMAFIETQAEAKWLSEAMLQVASYLPLDAVAACPDLDPTLPASADAEKDKE